MPLFKYEAVTAKCRCLYGKLLGPKDYENLLKCPDVSDIAVYLQDNTAYHEFLNGSDLRRINRNKLEYYIKKSMLNDYLKMYKFTFGNERYFINLLMAKYELEYILRAWREYVLKNIENNNNSVSKPNESEEDYFLGKGILEIQMIYQNNPRIDIEALKNITNAEQFINAIKNSDFFYIFEKHIKDDISKNYTEIETAVYDDYYKILYDSAEIFEKETRKKIQDSISTHADLLNLCRISRMLFNFKAGPEEIMPLLVPLRNRLKPDNINALLKSNDREKFLLYCQSNLSYGEKQSFYAYDSMSSYMNSFLYKYYKSKIKVSSSGFEVIVRYFHVKEFEVMNLFYLTEGIRYKMTPDYIRKNIYGLDYDPNKSSRGAV
ncbi:MAG: V-type ATPase subunit [Oscillospiraceae bacterium]|nr:V-type ATPase subunit [Oscillospiraceae bacterium]